MEEKWILDRGKVDGGARGSKGGETVVGMYCMKAGLTNIIL